MGMRACILDHDGSIRTTTLSPRTSVPHKSFRVFACGCLGMNRDVVGSVRQKSQAHSFVTAVHVLLVAFACCWILKGYVWRECTRYLIE